MLLMYFNQYCVFDRTVTVQLLAAHQKYFTIFFFFLKKGGGNKQHPYQKPFILLTLDNCFKACKTKTFNYQLSLSIFCCS